MTIQPTTFDVVTPEMMAFLRQEMMKLKIVPYAYNILRTYSTYDTDLQEWSDPSKPLPEGFKFFKWDGITYIEKIRPVITPYAWIRGSLEEILTVAQLSCKYIALNWKNDDVKLKFDVDTEDKKYLLIEPIFYLLGSSEDAHLDLGPIFAIGRTGKNKYLARLEEAESWLKTFPDLAKEWLEQRANKEA